MSKYVECISCSSDGFELICVKDGHQVVKCNSCGLTWVNPMPTEDEVYKLYREGSIIQESGIEEMGDDGFIIQPSWKVSEFSEIVRQISKLTSPGKVLDVGSLWGLFMELAREAGWEAYGVEPWGEAVYYCQSKLGLSVLQGVLADVDFPPCFFDAVVMLDVLEHCPDPRDVLVKISKILKNDGILCVLSPNESGLLPLTSGWLHKVFGQPWTYLTPPFHLYGFSPPTLSQLLTNQGFQVIKIVYLGIGARIRFSRREYNLRAVAKKTLSFVGRSFRMGDRMVVYARKQIGQVNGA